MKMEGCDSVCLKSVCVTFSEFDITMYYGLGV